VQIGSGYNGLKGRLPTGWGPRSNRRVQKQLRSNQIPTYHLRSIDGPQSFDARLAYRGVVHTASNIITRNPDFPDPLDAVPSDHRHWVAFIDSGMGTALRRPHPLGHETAASKSNRVLQ
jgi:hypothetical protein